MKDATAYCLLPTAFLDFGMHPEIEMLQTRAGHWEPDFVVERRTWQWWWAEVAGHLALWALIFFSVWPYLR